MSITGRGRFNIVVTDEYGNIAPGATVEIRTEPGLALTTLFTNRDGTGARANPLTADENGYAFAYAATGHYQLKLSVYGRERILRDVEIGTAAIASGDAPGLKYVFRLATDTAANPGVGNLRLNNASPASVTQIAVSFTGALASEPDYEAWLLSWATSSTLTNRGQIIIKDAANPSTYAVYRITGNTINAGTYGRFTVQHQSSHGSFVGGRDLSIEFARTGDAGSVTGGREQLTAARTYFVRPDGNNGNTGLTNTAGGAFLTIQRAINVVAALDIATHNVTIQLGNGTYTGATNITAPWVGSGVVSLVGNAANPQNVIVTTAAGNLFRMIGASRLTVSGFEVRTTSPSLSGFQVAENSLLTVGANMRFGACTFAQLQTTTGGSVFCRSPYAIVGGGTGHVISADRSGVDIGGQTITLVGTPNFTQAFAVVDRLSNVLMVNNTFVGAATGKRHIVNKNSVMTTGGATLPGSIAGTTDDGTGIYS